MKKYPFNANIHKKIEKTKYFDHFLCNSSNFWKIGYNYYKKINI